MKVSSALRRLVDLLRGVGILGTVSVLMSVIEDNYLKTFDRKYGVRTSGYIELSATSVDPGKRRHSNRYRGVNAWAFRRLLRTLSLPKTLHFVDLGCGLGRACILAAEYGFRKVTGVEFAPEFCISARENSLIYRIHAPGAPLINIVQADAMDYCEQTEDDIYFMFRPFSGEVFRTVLEKIAVRATEQNKAVIIIYSARMLLPKSELGAFSENRAFCKVYEGGMLGQMFYVYRCDT